MNRKELHPKKKVRKPKLNEFIDDEAQLSSEDEDKVSSDEDDESDGDADIEDLVDKQAIELDSDQEEEVRGLYHKQQLQEDRRDVLLWREHLEEQAGGLGQGRRKRFKWQMNGFMENNLKRHYCPDDDDDDGSEDDDDSDSDYLGPKLRKPDAESLLIQSTKIVTKTILEKRAHPLMREGTDTNPYEISNDDSNSNIMGHVPIMPKQITKSSMISSDIEQFVFRDKEKVQALSTKQTTIRKTREDKDKIIQREFNRVLEAKSIFDDLYN